MNFEFEVDVADFGFINIITYTHRFYRHLIFSGLRNHMNNFYYRINTEITDVFASLELVP